MEVVILILKHATTLRLSNTSAKALTLAELDYREANIDFKIKEYIKAFTFEDAVDFIMATNIGLFVCMHSSMRTISHLSLQPTQLHRISVSGNSCEVYFLPMVEEHKRKEGGDLRVNCLGILVVVLLVSSSP